MPELIFLTETAVFGGIRRPPEERRKGNGNSKKLILWYTSGFL